MSEYSELPGVKRPPHEIRAKEWMQKFMPSLDAAMGCPDVSPYETVQMFFEKIIVDERERAAKIARDPKNWAYPAGRAEATGLEIAKKILEQA